MSSYQMDRRYFHCVLVVHKYTYKLYLLTKLYLHRHTYTYTRTHAHTHTHTHTRGMTSWHLELIASTRSKAGMRCALNVYGNVNTYYVSIFLLACTLALCTTEYVCVCVCVCVSV